MKYEEILQDVLAGKWVRCVSHPHRYWIKMLNDGTFINEQFDHVRVYVSEYKSDTWEVKQKEYENGLVLHKESLEKELNEQIENLKNGPFYSHEFAIYEDGDIQIQIKLTKDEEEKHDIVNHGFASKKSNPGN